MATYSKLNTGKPTGADIAAMSDITDRIDNNEAALAGESSLNNIDITGGSIANVSAVITGGSIAGVTAAVTSLSCSGNASVVGNLSLPASTKYLTIGGDQTVEGTSTNDNYVRYDEHVSCIGGISYDSDDDVGLKQAVLELGAWDMEGTPLLTVLFPSTMGDVSVVHNVEFIIWNDVYGGDYEFSGQYHYNASNHYSHSFEADIAWYSTWYPDPTGIRLRVRTGGNYDTEWYNSLSFNRGTLLITYS